MFPDSSFAWLSLLALGAVHGINPAMGWLFAVSLGLQEGSGRAVWRSLGPLALGHALAVGAAVLAAAALGVLLAPGRVRWVAAAALFGLGALHLLRHRHPRSPGMRVGPRELALWSFLMASGHGAGLMALPFVLPPADAVAGHAAHLHGGPLALAAAPGADSLALLGMLVHTAGYLAVTGVVAVVVYEKLGLRLLRRVWINLDALWAAALMVTGALTLLP